MNVIRYVNGSWFAYTAIRVLGPFKFERQAINALRDENEDNE